MPHLYVQGDSGLALPRFRDSANEARKRVPFFAFFKICSSVSFHGRSVTRPIGSSGVGTSERVKERKYVKNIISFFSRKHNSISFQNRRHHRNVCTRTIDLNEPYVLNVNI